MTEVENITDIIGNRFGIPSEFVPMDFEMDPTTDDLIWGSSLEQGMIVLVDAITIREDPTKHVSELDHECDPYSCNRLKEKSRWCMVTDLRKHGDLVSFIALYADGTKRSRTYNQSFGWFVKKR